jgi:hypothetical protein
VGENNKAKYASVLLMRSTSTSIWIVLKIQRFNRTAVKFVDLDLSIYELCSMYYFSLLLFRLRVSALFLALLAFNLLLASTIFLATTLFLFRLLAPLAILVVLCRAICTQEFICVRPGNIRRCHSANAWGRNQEEACKPCA